MVAVNVEQLKRRMASGAFQNAGRLISARGVLTTTLNAGLGEMCELTPSNGEPVAAEVIGFDRGHTQLLSYQPVEGLKNGNLVTSHGRKLQAPVGSQLLGRVIDGLGQPLDGGPSMETLARQEVLVSAPDALARPRIEKPFITGQRVIDGLLTCGRGQRVALMAGSGVGKSMLLGEIAKGAESDINVVALIGERGREVQPFLEDCLGDGLGKSVVVVATSEQPALMRVRAAQTAVTIADGFRRMGKHVLLMVDSITRLAMAQREIGLSLGEPPGSRGYTPSVFRLLPSLLEQLGNSPEGSITGILTVLVDGDDLDEPVTDAVRSIVDGHIVLNRKLAEKGHFPAIDVSASISRVMHDVTSQQHRNMARDVRSVWTTLREVEDLVRIGAYQKGASPKVDLALAMESGLLNFLQQSLNKRSTFQQTSTAMQAISHQWGASR
jgi:flagellum-specific ATP synthase